MKIVNLIFLQFMAFSSGVVLAGGVFALIASIGVVTRFAAKTCTKNYINLYEDSIIVGGILGTLTMVFDFYLPIGRVGVVIFGLLVGVFVGCMAVSLAEILDIMPILSRRGNIYRGLSFFMVSIALGKLIGSLLYNILPGFYYG